MEFYFFSIGPKFKHYFLKQVLSRVGLFAQLKTVGIELLSISMIDFLEGFGITFFQLVQKLFFLQHSGKLYLRAMDFLGPYVENIVLIVAGFVVGIINTLAGGGSLLTLPLLIFMGLPPALANGTNRIAIVVQSLSGTLGFQSKGVSNYPYVFYYGISATFGALLGAQIAVEIDPKSFNRILAVLMAVVGILIVFNPQKEQTNILENQHGKALWISIVLFFLLGIYGGFINAGIGFLIILLLHQWNHLSLVKTNATKVMLVLIYSVFALGVFAYHGQVDWIKGAWLALGTWFGAWWSSRWSVRKGDRVVRYALLVMISFMAVRLWTIA